MVPGTASITETVVYTVLNPLRLWERRGSERLLLGSSTSTTGSTRRVPPRGSLPRQPVPGQSLLARPAVRWFLLRGDTSSRGPPPANPFSAGSALSSSLSISSFSFSPFREEDCYRGRRTCFPVCVRLRLFALVFVFHQLAGYRGGRTCFAVAVKYIIMVSGAKVYWFIPYMAVDLHLVFTSHTQGAVRVVSKVNHKVSPPVFNHKTRAKGLGHREPEVGVGIGTENEALLEETESQRNPRHSCRTTATAIGDSSLLVFA